MESMTDKKQRVLIVEDEESFQFVCREILRATERYEVITCASGEEALTHLKTSAFDAIVLDCPPNLGLLTLNALLAADHVLVPCDLSVLALEGVDDLMNTIGQLEMTFGRAPQILGLLHTRVDKRNHKQNAAIRRAVAQRYSGLAMDTEIAVNTSLPTAQLNGTSVFAAAPDSTGARDYSALAAEVRAKVFS